MIAGAASPRQGSSSHQSVPTGMMNSIIPPSTTRERGRQWVVMLYTRFGNLPREALGNLHGLDDAAALSHKARNVWARCHVAAFVQGLNMQSNGRFTHSCSPPRPFLADAIGATTGRQSNLSSWVPRASKPIRRLVLAFIRAPPSIRANGRQAVERSLTRGDELVAAGLHGKESRAAFHPQELDPFGPCRGLPGLGDQRRVRGSERRRLRSCWQGWPPPS